MHRRRFIGIAAGGLVATLFPAVAQPAANVRRIGLLTAGNVSSQLPPAFFDELRKRGWFEGETLLIEGRGGDGHSSRVPGLAAELVKLGVDIVTFGAVAGVAAKNATTTIPIVATTGDPVRLGLVSNLSHPGGNITGRR